MKIHIAAAVLVYSYLCPIHAGPTDEALKQYIESQEFTSDTLILMTNGSKTGSGNSIRFAEGKYAIDNRHMTEESGTYTVKGATIQLQGQIPAKCKLDENSKSLIFSAELNCGGSKIFFPASTRRPEGSEIKFGSELLITMAKKRGDLTTPAVFRTKPTTKGKAIRCPDDGSSPLNATTADGQPGPSAGGFEIIGRTKEMAKVGKWNNYWYYVFVPFNEFALSCSNRAGWVYAEFVRIQD